MNDSIFRLYDIRGTYPSQINERVVFSIARKLKKVFSGQGAVVIGYDARVSSYGLHTALREGLSRANIAYYDIGFCSTPMVVYFVHTLKSAGGIMVTASHNPKEYNGLKFFDARGMGIGGTNIKKQLGRIQPEKYNETAQKTNLGKSKYHQQYAHFLKRFISVNRPLKVVIDTSNGSTGPIWEILARTMRKQGVTCIILNKKCDGVFSAHGPNPLISSAHQDTKDAIKKHHADMGVIIDGDGDRAVFLDEQGNVVSAGHIWRLLAAYKKIKKSVVSVVNAFHVNVFKKTLTHPVYITASPVGHVFLRSLMRKTKSDIGIEGSGHYYFSSFFYSDSAVMAALSVINALSRLPYALSRYVDMLPGVYQIPEQTVTASKNHLKRIYKLLLAYGRKNAYKVSDSDGISLTSDNAWCNVRYANTESVARVNIAGVNMSVCKVLKNDIRSMAKRVHVLH
ncbi:MAG: hypothetical protein KBC26_01830 [Candidatus Pacebacteria bacterium]|nr:hypothetical protein [Candidatus Paceibacterota bacterium]